MTAHRCLAGSVGVAVLVMVSALAPAASHAVLGAQALPTRVALHRSVGARVAPTGLGMLVVAPAPDAWFGADKFRHAGACTAIQLMGYGILRAAGAGRTTAFLGASAVTIAAAVGKEVWDARKGGRASGRDLAWDGVGMVLGSGLARFADPP